MNSTKNTMLASCFLFFGAASLHAQKSVPSKNFVFSAIKGTMSRPDSLKLPSNAKSATLVEGDGSAFKILSSQKGKLVLAFSPSENFTGVTREKLQVKDPSGRVLSSISLTGLSTKGLEGSNEAPLSLIIEALGYRVNTGWTSLDNHALPQMLGEEIASPLFKKAGKEKVDMIPVARYSPDFELPFGYYINSASAPQKKQVGVLAKKNAYPEHQILFPAMAAGSFSFDPGQSSFGFYANGPTHTAYSEDAWNMLFHPSNAVHATRIYPVKDENGKPLQHTYLVCFEEAKNGDFNDYVFLVKNIAPVTATAFTSLFNGKNLDGWNTFLRNIGRNTDPGNNFRVENEMLYVKGKDLGYAITEKAYTNYHFKVDFKWGEKKWPPREDAKRDAGICYNIPMNEPDSIWPRSVECQIQEGDTGDFWLLGFTTIKVDGKENTPMNHARMIKQRDAEKPYGEWNTVEVISVNGKCVHIVNGVVVNVGEEASVKSGRILLQSEYAEIYYRNIKIREL